MLIGTVAAGAYPGVEATGGTTSTYSSGGINYKVHTFSLGTSTFAVQNGGSIDYLIVAGGGCGGYGNGSPFGTWGGGGGGGGLLTGTTNVTTGTNYSITVGAGGVVPGSNNTDGGSGSNSTAFSLTAIGGGGKPFWCSSKIGSKSIS